LRFEPLEDRALLSVVAALPANLQSQPTYVALHTSSPSVTSSPSGLLPNQIRGAYGLGTYSAGSGSVSNGNYVPGTLQNGISFGGTNGDGSGETIAIVDAYDDPNALSDLNAFSSYINGSVNFGLPTVVTAGGTGSPTFEKVNEYGSSSVSSLPGTDPAGKYNGKNDDWEIEESADIEWAHAMAPMANIILVEANSNSNADLFQAVETAANMAGVVAVSMSWGGSEFSGETSFDSDLITPAGHAGVTFLASTGDSGAYASGTTTITPDYPASSPDVVAVGGTILDPSGNSYSSESSWGNGASSGSSGGGGGGVSGYESLFATNFQSGVVSSVDSTDNGLYSASAPHRTYPDVSANAGSAMPIYDSYVTSRTGDWVDGFGGTSFACPIWAGMIAVADEGRGLSGLGSLNGATQTLPLLYQIDSAAAASFHDITTGSSIGPTSGLPSYSPASGYDLATGIGSPAGNLLIPRLIGIPTVTTTASASPSPATGTTTVLSVVASTSDAASNLTYTWSTTSAPAGAAPTFSVNGTNAANDTTATFFEAGTYTFSVSIADTLTGGSTTSSVSVTVNPALTSIALTPASSSLSAGGTQQFSAIGRDQFGNALASQPAFTWSATTGTITSGGLFTAPDVSASGTVKAASGGVSATAPVTITNHVPTVATPAAASPSAVTGSTTDLSVLGADDAGEANLTYTWAATAVPAGANAPTFSANGTNASKNTTATFFGAGPYTFTATITDAGGLTVTSSTSVTVAATFTSVAVSPLYAGLAAGGSQSFAATALDQFGKALASQPSFTWTATPGSITSGGLYTAPDVSATATIQAESASIAGTAIVSVTNHAPTVATAAGASPNPVAGTTTALSVLGADDAGESNLSYTWTATAVPAGAIAPTFSSNGMNASKNTTATFFDAGSYGFTVTITDAGGLTATSSTTVTVAQTSTSIAVSPVSASLSAGGSQQFAATALDQFGNAMASQPSFVWTATSGSISSDGYYTAPDVSAAVTVEAAADSIDGAASVTVTNNPPTVATVAAASPNPISGTTTALSVLGADDAGESNLTYTWAATTVPAGINAPAFSADGTRGAKNTTATFYGAGSYTFTATITDAGGLTVTSSASVTVAQTVTSIAVVPESADLGAVGTEPFAATAFDQFGDALATQPAFSWSVLGAGSIDGDGNYAPPYTAGSATVVASSGPVTGTYGVTFPGSALWTSASSGSWDSGDWTGTVSDASVAAPGLRSVAGDTVVFDTSSATTVTLDGANPSVAGVAFEGSANDQIAQGSGGTLQLDNGSNSATITIAAGNQAIAAPVLLSSNLVVSPAAGSQLTIAGGVSGAGQSLSVNGQGTVVLSAANGYGGGTLVSAGTVIATDPSAIPTDTSLTVGAGGTLILDPPSDAGPAEVVAAAAPMIASSADTAAAPVVTSSDASVTTAAPVATDAASSGLVLAPQAALPLFGGTRLSSAHPTATLSTPAAERIVGSSIDRGLLQTLPPSPPGTVGHQRPALVGMVPLPQAGEGSYSDLDWLGQDASSSEASDPQYKNDVSIQALDAMFAQYGR
jgi:autotransporter-associated beta strand protein